MCSRGMTRPRADPVTEEPTILLGVGATKAGTSWLYEHLSAHPECHLRAVKELHYFDTLENRGFGRQMRDHTAQARQLMARVQVTTGPERERLLQRLADVLDWMGVISARKADDAAYLRYLAGGGRRGRRIVAEITPAYALLPEERLRRIAGMAADVRFLYLMRDPVARLWSQLRMMAAREARRAEAVPELALSMLEEVLGGGRKGAVARGDYRAALARLNAAVDPRRLMVLFQEELFSAPGLERLSTWLGIRPQPGNFTRRVHEGVPVILPEAQRQRVRDFLQPQYDYVARHYPDRIPASWRQNMGEDAT